MNRQLNSADSAKDGRVGGGGGGGGPPRFIGVEWRLALPCAVCTFHITPRHKKMNWNKHAYSSNISIALDSGMTSNEMFG